MKKDKDKKNTKVKKIITHVFIRPISLDFATLLFSAALILTPAINVSNINGMLIIGYIVDNVIKTANPNNLSAPISSKLPNIVLTFQCLAKIPSKQSVNNIAATTSKNIGADNVLTIKGIAIVPATLDNVKPFTIGLSMCSLLLTGLSPELAASLESVNIQSISPAMNELLNLIKEIGNKVLNFVNQNKQTIESISTTASITAESIVATDYTIKAIKGKDKNSNTYKIAELIKNKKFVEYAKKVLFDENYYKETKDMPILEKLCPPELRDEIKRKKLTPDK